MKRRRYYLARGLGDNRWRISMAEAQQHLPHGHWGEMERWDRVRRSGAILGSPAFH